MAANEFEKNVQKAMDEFKLHPSGEVWEKIAERIGERKKKRRIIFFIIFSGVALGLGGYGFYHFKENKKLVSETGVSKPGGSNSAGDVQKGEENKTNIPGNVQTKNKTGANGITPEKEFNKTSVYKKGLAVQDKNKLTGKKLLTVDHTFALMEKQPLASVNKKESEKNLSTDLQSQDTKLNGHLNSKEESSNDVGNKENSVTKAETKTDQQKEPDSASAKNKNDQANFLSQDKKIKKVEPSGKILKWGLDISVGSSTLSQDRFSFKNKSSGGNAYLSSPAGPIIGSPSGFTNPPVPNRSSLAFKAGVALKISISKRSSILTGISYNYLADKIKTGTKQNTTLQVANSYNTSVYYTSTSQKEFTDRFHFIEVPLVYDWRITGNKDHFISVNSGISAAYLLCSNALVYDTSAGGIYYHNKNVLHRTHINFSSGLSWHFSKKQFECIIGPQFSFDLVRNINSDLDNRKYFIYSGLDAKIFLNKKKKK